MVKIPLHLCLFVLLSVCILEERTGKSNICAGIQREIPIARIRKGASAEVRFYP